MRVENASLVGAHAGAHLSLHVQELVPRLSQRSFQAVDLLRQGCLRQEPPGNRRARSIQNENLPAAHSGRNRYAPESYLSLRQRFWHGPFLAEGLRVGKEI